MPKELTHLIVAEASRHRFSTLSGNGFLSEKLQAYTDYFRFGAVMHDIAFYASSSANGDIVKEKGYMVHGNPANDTMAPFKYLAALYDHTGQPELLAMIAGAVTHMLADCQFHPFVYFYAGLDITRHYRLETLIDTHLSGRQDTLMDTPVTTRGFYKHLRNDLDDLARYLAVFYGLKDTFTPELIKALNMHAFALRLFRSRLGYLFFRLTSELGSRDYKIKTQLFYPAGMRFRSPFFASEFTYRHPVTGEPGRDCLESFVEKAVEKACKMFEEIQSAAVHRSLERFFETRPPVSLETGLDPSMGKEFRYTDMSLSIDSLVAGEADFS